MGDALWGEAELQTRGHTDELALLLAPTPTSARAPHRQQHQQHQQPQQPAHQPQSTTPPSPPVPRFLSSLRRAPGQPGQSPPQARPLQQCQGAQQARRVVSLPLCNSRPRGEAGVRRVRLVFPPRPRPASDERGCAAWRHEFVMEGDRVLGNWRGLGTFYSARVCFVRQDGAFDLQYDDGDTEQAVPLTRLLPLLRPHHTVQVRCGNHRKAGRIVRVHAAKGTYCVQFDDGTRNNAVQLHQIECERFARFARKRPAYSQATLPALPQELLLAVLSHLEAEDVRSVRNVCRRLRRVASDARLLQSVAPFKL